MVGVHSIPQQGFDSVFEPTDLAKSFQLLWLNTWALYFI